VQHTSGNFSLKRGTDAPNDAGRVRSHIDPLFISSRLGHEGTNPPSSRTQAASMSLDNERKKREALLFASTLRVVVQALLLFVISPHPGSVSGNLVQEIRTQPRCNREVDSTRTDTTARREPNISRATSLNTPLSAQGLLVRAGRRPAFSFSERIPALRARTCTSSLTAFWRKVRSPAQGHMRA
jgi:hypothetical protein